MTNNKNGYKSHNFCPFEELKVLGEDLERSDLVLFALYRTNYVKRLTRISSAKFNVEDLD